MLKQKGAVVWLTGLSGSGKSTLAYALEQRLAHRGKLAFVLDGDNVRMGLCRDLGFTPEDRSENIRRVGEVAGLFAASGLLVIASFISPYKKGREAARGVCQGEFIEVHLDVSVAVCEGRDPKGLYKKARSGDILDFTGISAPYEAPTDPEIRLNTEAFDVDACVDEIIKNLDNRRLLD